MNAPQTSAIQTLADSGFPREADAIRANPCEDTVASAEASLHRFQSASLGEAHTRASAVRALARIRLAFELWSEP